MVFTTFDSTQTNQFSSTFIGLGRNRMINGDMSVDQRNAGASISLNAGSNQTKTSVDQLICTAFNDSGIFTVQQQVLITPPGNFTSYIRTTVSTASATPGSTAQYYLTMNTEGTNVKDFGFGTSGAVTFTVSFWVRSSLTGTFSLGFLNDAPNRSYPTTYTINSANTWELKKITVAGDVVGPSGWSRDSSGRGIQIVWDLGSGTGKEGTTNTWQSANVFRVSGTTRLIATNAATFDLTGVQLEMGSAATNFEFVPPELQLAYCQRYYEIGTIQQTMLPIANITAIRTEVDFGWTFKVTKRVSPTITMTTTQSTQCQLAPGAFGTVSDPTSSWPSSAGAITTDSFTLTANRGSNTTYPLLAYSATWTASAAL